MIKRVWIRIEKGENNCCACAPAAPGCIVTDDTVEATKARMIRALKSHLEWMLEDEDSLDGINDVFPADATDESDVYYCLVQLDVSRHGVPAGV